MASHSLLSLRDAEMFDTQKESLETQSRAELSTSKIFFAITKTYNDQSRYVEFNKRRNVFTHRRKT